MATREKLAEKYRPKTLREVVGHADAVCKIETVLRARGIRTWISIEPVIDPAQALAVLDFLHGEVDAWKVGKLNHDREREKAIDWRAFLGEVLARRERWGLDLYVKDALAAFARPGEIPAAARARA